MSPGQLASRVRAPLQVLTRHDVLRSRVASDGGDYFESPTT
jgi:hypothetical protein